MKIPVITIKLKAGKITRIIEVGIIDELPMKNIDLLLGNDVNIEINEIDGYDPRRSMGAYNLRNRKGKMNRERETMAHKESREATLFYQVGDVKEITRGIKRGSDKGCQLEKTI